ncbi:MAG TPA: hemolysin family protein [Candidatus Competibacteraceae bacterium]|nr:hemolysin family protein [Candidatus Competibacteraceae bacterium]
MIWELLIILLLILLNGFFAMSELAVVSARRARLVALAEQGQRGAAAALRLAEEPGRFLSTVQIGITLIGIFAGAYGGATLSGRLAEALAALPALAPFSEALALGLVVAGITYLSLIVGELVPKQLALHHAERIAIWVAVPMQLLDRLAAPLVYLLDISSRLMLRLLGAHGGSGQKVTDEEIKTLIAEATAAGVVESAEQAMISAVMRLADRPVRAIMTPRPDIVWLDLEDSAEEHWRIIRESRYSRFPVSRGDIDEVVGIVQVKDLLEQAMQGGTPELAAAVREPLVVHDGLGALKALEMLKQSPLQMALVVDEYGSLQGLVTATDVLESIVGELAEQDTGAQPGVMQREDGSWLVDGGLALDELKELLRLRELPEEGEFHTLAGLTLSQLGHVPTTGEHFTLEGYRFEVVDMDGRRVDKVLISRQES